MLTFEEAKSAALEVNDAYNYCTEYEGAYLFSDYDSLSIGGLASPIVIVKETGAVLSYPACIGTDLLKNEIRADRIKHWK